MNASDKPSLDVVVAGYLCVDLAPRFNPRARDVSLSELLRPGKLVEVDGMETSLGGVVANTGLALKRYGRSVAMNALVGEDELGDLAIGLLERHGCSGGIRRTNDAGTAFGFVIAPPGTDRVFLESPGCSRIFGADSIDYDRLARARIFHFGYPSLMQRFYTDEGAELVSMFEKARSTGVATSLDMALPDPESESGQADWQRILERTLPFVDIFMPSAEELVYMLDPNAYGQLTKGTEGDILDAIPVDLFRSMGGRLIKAGVKVLLVKAGHRGAWLMTGNVSELSARTQLKLRDADWNHREMWIPPVEADEDRFQNACGAGDAAVAGFLAAMLEGSGPEEAAAIAMVTGRDNLYGADALSGLRGWRETLSDARTKRTCEVPA